MNTLNTYKKLTIIILTILLDQSLSAENSVVTFSAQKVMLDSETGKALQERVLAKQKELASPLQAEEQKIQTLEKELLRDKESLEKDFAEHERTSKTFSAEMKEQAAEKLRDRAVKFDDKKREFERAVQKIQAEGRKIEAKITEFYQKETAKVEALAKDIVKDLAQRNNWDLVIPEEQVMYSSPKISKTSVIIEALDKKTKENNQAKKQALEEKQNESNKNIKAK